MLDSRKVDALDDFAVEEVDEHGFDLHESGMGIEEVRSKMHERSMPWSRFFRLTILVNLRFWKTTVCTP